MKTEFDKIAGYKEEKKELLDICYLVNNRLDLQKAGGKLPKGLCLIGPNGVGKTALAKAFCSEAKCNIVSVNYNDVNCDDDDFTDYIKDCFEEAASKVPCILFIDELDKLVGNNREFFMASNFDRSRVLLNEINKYTEVDGLFLLVVANSERYIDYSILRSGRIDKIINMNLPNEEERKQIIQYYCKGKCIDKSVSISNLSIELSGFSGADIESLLNNAVIRVFTENRKVITENDIMNAFCDKVFNCKEKENNMKDPDMKMLAYHEAGHASVSLLLDPLSVSCATILQRNNIKGFVKRRQRSDFMETFDSKKDQIKVALGGIAAEELFFGKRSIGSSSDIASAKKIVANLVRRQGMCGFDKIEIFSPIDEETHYMEGTDSSEARIKRIEDQEDKILDELYEETKKLLSENKDLVKKLADKLLNSKFLNSSEVNTIYQSSIRKGA